MAGFDLLIRGGTLILPDEGKEIKLNVAVSGGRIAALTADSPEAREVIDADGLFVAPGFIDTHMHDEEVEDGDTVELALLRQGVTTAFAGNCGTGPLARDILPFRERPWLNLGYLTGHTKLREAAGVQDIYSAAPPEAVAEMKSLLRSELQNGSFGLSVGLEYLPETPPSEVEALFETAAEFEKIWIPVHIRSDGPAAVNATDEILGYAEKWPLRFQISHAGSMTAFGRLAEVLAHIDSAVERGLDVTFDCYPYDAFCTRLGSAVFDPGFEERWGKGRDALEIGSGALRGRRLDEAGLYERLRKEAPDTLIIAHVMRGDEVELCLSHPRCAVASDSLLKNGHGHPRAAGTFPRALRMLRDKGFSWPEAVRRCTSLPASMAWLEDKGRIAEGCAADFVIFNGDELRDNATFRQELLPPSGVKWVVLGGETAVKENEITGAPKGKLLRRSA
ncbi:MAG: amidohydrolase family protein [Synergistaceae bacterium]|nr:amidohydrolase family protein [Synergistaceae bacterium]